MLTPKHEIAAAKLRAEDPCKMPAVPREEFGERTQLGYDSFGHSLSAQDRFQGITEAVPVRDIAPECSIEEDVEET